MSDLPSTQRARNRAVCLRPAHLAFALVSLAMLRPVAVRASGPMGHFIMSSHTIRQINGGQLDVPPELRQVLKDPSCQRAFNGGAIGPDLIEKESHYGNTADLAQKLRDTARDDMRRAAAARDQGAFDEAKRELAFAYGWLSHCAADLNTHPKVNEQVGDTFRDLDKGGQFAHGAREGQETAYLKQTLWNPQDKYDVYVPGQFLSRVSGVSADQIAKMRRVLNGKAEVELIETGFVKLSHEELRRIWETTVRESMHDTADFIRDPSKLKNWDLDCGRIPTDDFDLLHRMAITLSGGTLPKDWGKNYLAWYAALKDLPRSQWTSKLRQLMGLQSAQPAAPSGPTTTHYKLELAGYWGHLDYTISGAVLDPPTGSDRGNVGGRQYRGKLAGRTLTVSGSAVSDNESSGAGSGDYYELVVSVTVGNQTRNLSYIAPKGEKLSKNFDLSVPIDPGATSGSVRIHLLEQNANYGPHGWVVGASMSR